MFGSAQCVSGSVGALLQSPSDASMQEMSEGDLETVRRYAARVAEVATRLHG
ncbi:hypothetical protein [Roseateles sp. SL47]|uniref:hypothetical protein n=1 Tax=Roseateles sp. SL47 TaxID=2995138 RepID=UPI003B635997